MSRIKKVIRLVARKILPDVRNVIAIRCDSSNTFTGMRPAATTNFNPGRVEPIESKDEEYSVSKEMRDAISAVGWTSDGNSSLCFDYAKTAVLNAIATEKDKHILLDHKKCGIGNNWDKKKISTIIGDNWDEKRNSIINKRPVTPEEKLELDRVIPSMGTFVNVNANMLDYIKNTLKAKLPVLVGVNNGGAAVNNNNRLINDGVTNHFLVLVSYAKKDGKISNSGLDNAKPKTAGDVTFYVNSKNNEMYKPRANESGDPPAGWHYIDRKKYRITWVCVWKEITPRDWNGVWGFNRKREWVTE